MPDVVHNEVEGPTGSQFHMQEPILIVNFDERDMPVGGSNQLSDSRGLGLYQYRNFGVRPTSEQRIQFAQELTHRKRRLDVQLGSTWPSVYARQPAL